MATFIMSCEGSRLQNGGLTLLLVSLPADSTTASTTNIAKSLKMSKGNLTATCGRKGGPPLSGWKRPLTRSLDVLTPPFMAVTCGPSHNVVEQTPSCRWRGTAPCTRPPRMAVSAHSLRTIPSAPQSGTHFCTITGFSADLSSRRNPFLPESPVFADFGSGGGCPALIGHIVGMD